MLFGYCHHRIRIFGAVRLVLNIFVTLLILLQCIVSLQRVPVHTVTSACLRARGAISIC